MATKKLKAQFWRTEFYGAVTEGGTATLHNGKIAGLHKLGHKVSYVSSGPMVMDTKVKYYYVPYNNLLRNLPEIPAIWYNGRSIREFLNIMEIEKPDFIYKHHHDFHYGGSEIKKKTGIPFILHIDGVTTWVKEKWGKVYNHRLLKISEEIEIYNSDAIVVPSQNLKNQVLDLFDVPEHKIFVAPNGVDNDMFYPEISGDRIRKKYNLADKFVFGFTGTFGDWHGVDVMAESVKHVIKKIPNAFFLFVGDGNLRPKLDDILNRDNVSNYAKITGFMPYKEIPEFLSASDVLLAPSVNNPDVPFFNSPVKLFEYMAMEKPIIATDVGQQKDVFQNEVNSLVVKENNPKHLADGMIRLYENKDLRDKIALGARKDAIEKYDWKVNAEIIIDAYNYSIKQRKS